MQGGPNAEFESFRQMIETHRLKKAEAIMVVGHNPTMSAFLSLLVTGGASRSGVEMKKGGVARLELSPRRTAILKWSFTPKVVKAIYESSGAKSRPNTSRK